MIGELTTQLSSHPTSKRAGLYCKAVQLCHIHGHFTTAISQIIKKNMCILGNPTLTNFLGEIIFSQKTRQSAQWGTYTHDQSYRHFLKSTKYVALTLEMAVVCYML